jgi:hypothetical protein
MLASVMLEMQRLQSAASYTFADNPTLRRFVLYDIELCDDDTLYRVREGHGLPCAFLRIVRAGGTFIFVLKRPTPRSCPRTPKRPTSRAMAKSPSLSASPSNVSLPLHTHSYKCTCTHTHTHTRTPMQGLTGRGGGRVRGLRPAVFKEARSSSLPDLYDDLVRTGAGNKTPPRS